MKNKLILLLTLLAVPSVAFAAAGMVDRIKYFRHWIYPAYLYNLKFGIAFLIGFVVLYFVFRKPLDKGINRFRAYLRNQPELAILVYSLLFAVPFGIYTSITWLLLSEAALLSDIILFCLFPILLLNKWFRNRVFLSSILFKIMILIVISAICASLLFIALTYAGALDMSKLSSYYSWSASYSHPIYSVKIIWSGVLLYLIVLPLYLLGILLVLRIGDAYRWLKDKLKQEFALQKFD